MCLNLAHNYGCHKPDKTTNVSNISKIYNQFETNVFQLAHNDYYL